MRIEIKSATVHAPFILGGFNLGPKLETCHKHSLTMAYDDVKQLLLITCNNVFGMVPVANIVSMIPTNPSLFEVKKP